MAGRLKTHDDGVVTWTTGEAFLGPDVREAAERLKQMLTEIDISLNEALRAFENGDIRVAKAWVLLAEERSGAAVEQLNRDIKELDARMAENIAGFRRAFPGMRIFADLSKS